MNQTNWNACRHVSIAYPSSTHFIYARAHVNPKSKASKPANVLRTLFLVNVPPIWTGPSVNLHCSSNTFDFNSADVLIENTSDSDEEMADTEDADAGAGAEVSPRKKQNSILPSQSYQNPTPMYTTQNRVLSSSRVPRCFITPKCAFPLYFNQAATMAIIGGTLSSLPLSVKIRC